jgi:hypothetical protein
MLKIYPSIMRKDTSPSLIENEKTKNLLTVFGRTIPKISYLFGVVIIEI